ncbi:MAG: polymerase-3 subunit epsilon [Actinomycetia bacterium]|nr:polymerase-3 subunit epsilon [Actinomycetes bacterium]MDQ1656749.1 polymerase subunit epsilon [Cryptosporangiaceae bacterium]
MSVSSAETVPAWVVVDIETTGLSPREHRIAEVAVVVLDLAGNVLGEACTLVDPAGDLGSVEAHGIRPEHLAGAPRFPSIAGWLQSWLAGNVVVGHNLLFTSAFLDEEFRRAGVAMPHIPVICTMTHAPRYLPSLPGRTLEQCCAAAGIEIGEPRSALTRARAAAALFNLFLSHRQILPSPWRDSLEKAKRMAWPPTPIRDFPMVARPQPEAAARPAWSAGTPSGAQAYPSAGRASVPTRGSARVPTILDGEVLPSAKQAEKDAAQSQQDSEQFVADVVDAAPRNPDETGAVTAYLGALDAAVSDRVLSFTEAIHLKDLASALAIFEAEQAGAHRTYLRTLAATAWADRQLTDGERIDLLAVGKLLDVPEHEVDEVIAEAMPRRQRTSAVTGSAAVSAVPASAAWYPDPYNEAQLRWWDGSAWTSHVHN